MTAKLFYRVMTVHKNGHLSIEFLYCHAKPPRYQIGRAVKCWYPDFLTIEIKEL